MIESVWFAAVAFLLVGYVVLDGFDLGAGIIHFFVGRTREEREQVVASIGPVWDGNEVWLITAGGSLFLAFPKLYAVAFGGFYLPLTLVLWLLVFRALGIEVRHHVHDPLWQDFWDAAFSAASLVLALSLGVALGNVVRGVTFEGEERFFTPLWTDFGTSEPVGLFDYYTILVGLTAVASLALHGALWVTMRTDGPLKQRAARSLWPLLAIVLLLAASMTAASLGVQPRILHNLGRYPAWAVLPALAVAGFIAIPIMVKKGRLGAAFVGSAIFLAGMLGSAAFGIHPYVLPGTTPGEGLILWEAAADQKALSTGLIWWIPGMLLALLYVIVLYRRISYKVQVGTVEP